MVKNLSTENYMDIFHFADVNAYSQMFQQCQDFVAKHITDIARTSAFLFLTPAELAGILAIHSIDSASDPVLFDSLLHWFQHDPTACQRHLCRLYHDKSAPPVLPLWHPYLFFPKLFIV